ncbi:MAG: tRNA-intron lyase, partial [Haloferacaceae archaeon]
MEGRLRDEGPDATVVVGGDARQRFHDARGYGRPLDGNRIALAPVEAAHLLFRGDLDAVAAGKDRLAFRDLLVRTGVVLEFVVYKDLRDRGFYLSPAREDWVDADASGADFVVYPRGKGPGDGAVAHRIRVLGEREPVPLASLGEVVLAVVDEEGELTYLDTDHATAAGEDGPGGGRSPLPDAVEASLLADRALVWDPPAALHEAAFYGQRLAGRSAEEGPLQVSLVEAAYLARHGALALEEAAVVERGREVEGERFDRRLTAYAALRDAGSVPKSGFKFGADFRVYDEFESLDEMGHSDRLVRVVEPDHEAVPRDLSLDVRLAGGVRKRMV